MCSSHNEKTTFLVLFHYDINRGYACNYNDIQRQLEQIGNVIEFQTNTWFLETQLGAGDISTLLRDNLSGAESLLIVALGSDLAFSGILPEKIEAIARRSR